METNDDFILDEYLKFTKEEGDHIEDLFVENYDGDPIFAVQLLVSQLFLEKKNIVNYLIKALIINMISKNIERINT